MLDKSTVRETRTLTRWKQNSSSDGPVMDVGLIAEDRASSQREISKGTALGRYIVLYRIGSGGMGEVYAAYDPQLDRKIAIKVLRSDLGRQTGKAMRREAAALARLIHPNVVTVFDFDETAGRQFIAMEFIAGLTLKEWLAEEHPSRQQVVAMFSAAGRGLAAAHDAGLAHRDFKPSNAMLTVGGDVKVLDFGLASDPSLDNTVDEATRWLGTPLYMAPERLDGHPGDALSDQFSFCAALFEALTGNTPCPTTGRGQRFTTPLVEQAANSIPARLRRTLRKGLARRPEERFSDLPELLESLAPVRIRRSGLVAAAVLVVGLLLVGQARSNGPRCDGGSQKMVGLWDTARKEQLEASFLAAGVPFAVDSWRGIESELDRYMGSWQEMHTETCEATHLRGEQSAALLDRRMSCLDSRLQAVKSVTDLLIDADAKTLSKSGAAIDRLRSLDDCADRERLTSLVELPDEPAVLGQITELYQVAADQIAKFHLGQHPDLQALEAADSRSVKLGYPPLEGELAYVLGKLQQTFAVDATLAEETLLRALERAIAGRDRQLQVRVYTELTEATGRANPEGGKLWERLGRAALEAMPSASRELAYELETASGLVDWAAGEYEQTREHFVQALALAEQVWGPNHPRLARPIGNLGMMGGGPGVERAIAILEHAYGRNSPMLSSHLVNIASHLANKGLYNQALEQAERCDRLVADAYGEDNRDRILPLTLLAQIYLAADRPWLAEPALRRALALIVGGAPNVRREADLNVVLAKALHRQQRDLEALPYAEEALARVETQVSPKDPLTIEVMIVAGSVLRELGRLTEAEAHLAKAREMVAGPADDLQRLELQAELAETLLIRGQSAVAVPLLEVAIEHVRADMDRGLAARLRFLLARALVGDDAARAGELATAATAGLDENNRWHQQLRAEIESFLATSGLVSTDQLIS